jgi:hypothetical protein
VSSTLTQRTTAFGDAHDPTTIGISRSSHHCWPCLRASCLAARTAAWISCSCRSRCASAASAKCWLCCTIRLSATLCSCSCLLGSCASWAATAACTCCSRAPAPLVTFRTSGSCSSSSACAEITDSGISRRSCDSRCGVVRTPARSRQHGLPTAHAPCPRSWSTQRRWSPQCAQWSAQTPLQCAPRAACLPVSTRSCSALLRCAPAKRTCDRSMPGSLRRNGAQVKLG